MKKTLIISLASASLLVGGVAVAKTYAHGDRGPVTRAEVTEMSANRFAKMDVNGDGQLDPSDREARRTARFAEADTNGDGALTQEEMTAAREARKADRETRRAERGGVDGQRMGRRGEGKRGGKRHGMRGGKRMMEMADTNNDGAISQAEFQTAAMARFDKADTNADGTVTVEERKAAREARRGDRQSRRQAS